MAEDVTIIDGLGSNQAIATDQVVDPALGTAHVQYTKLMDGAVGGTGKAAVDETGALSVSDIRGRQLQEQQYLQGVAAYGALLDPVRGFEIR